MPKHPQRAQKALPADLVDVRPLVVNPLIGLVDRLHNPKDLEPDTAAMSHGVDHGGGTARRVETRVRGSGGRKRSKR